MDWPLDAEYQNAKIFFVPEIGAILKNPNDLPFVGRQVQSLASFRLSNEQFSPIEAGFFRKQCWVAP
jgi:hypothetical protein